MKSLREYISEAEQTVNNPAAGDVFFMEIAPDSLVETIVAEVDDHRVIIEMDDHGIQLLLQHGFVVEDGNSPAQPAATDSTSPINGAQKKTPAALPRVKKTSKSAYNEVNHEQSSDETRVAEAKYRGRTVKLGKPFLTPDGPKKRSVYVKNAKGNVVKVNFGSKEMRIKKSNPARRKNFRARHNCSNPGPRWKARYWSCRAW